MMICFDAETRNAIGYTEDFQVLTALGLCQDVDTLQKIKWNKPQK